MPGFEFVKFFCARETEKTIFWRESLEKKIKQKIPAIKILEDSENFDDRIDFSKNLLVTLGGDGTILKSIRSSKNLNSLILALNTGLAGFLSSVRNEEDFDEKLNELFERNFSILKRSILRGDLIREGKIEFSSYSLNEILIQNLISMVNLRIFIDSMEISPVYGSGVLVSTPTGSTAQNLSLHGPILEPSLDNIVLTRLMDHKIPIPSIVFSHKRKIEIFVEDFREKDFILDKKGSKIDVILSFDSCEIVPLQRKDLISISSAGMFANFIVFEKEYFFERLNKKFKI